MIRRIDRKEPTVRLSPGARAMFGRAVLAANRPDLCTFCVKPKAERNPECVGHQYRPEKSA